MNNTSNRAPPADENMDAAFSQMTFATQSQSWSFDGIPRRDRHQNQPAGLLQSMHAPQNLSPPLPERIIRGSNTPGTPLPNRYLQNPVPSAPPLSSRRSVLQNPFGTLEEIQSENYQSPLEGMFQRAEARYREAETLRQQAGEANVQTALDEVLRIAAGEGHIEMDLNLIDHATVQLILDVQEAGEGMRRNSLVPLEYRRPERPIAVNPIDEQTSRPAPLNREDLTINIACQVCSEQRVDTLLEPCMHIAICRWCSEILRRGPRQVESGHGHASRAHRWRCPICRRRVTSARRVYLS